MGKRQVRSYPSFSRMLEAICVLLCSSSTQAERGPVPGNPDPPTQWEWFILPSDRGRGLPIITIHGALPSPGTPPRSKSPGKQQPDWGGRAAWLPRHARQRLTVLRGDLGDFLGELGYFSEFFFFFQLKVFQDFHSKGSTGGVSLRRLH